MIKLRHKKHKGSVPMSWECKTMEETREAFVRAAESNPNFSEVCREFNITRKTGYKWLNRYRDGMPMSDMDKTPKSVANKTSPDVEQLILNVRAENPGWGARTIHKVLENRGYDNLPCVKTVNNILNRNNCIDPAESAKRIQYIRYAREHCNEMWQTDFKGEFLMNNGRYCYPLDIIDDCSRFLIKIAPFESTVNVVISSFEQAFKEFGMPRSVLCDNGGQFRGLNGGYTHFEKWLMDFDILPIHGSVHHPQTQGKIERMHRSMKEELLRYRTFDDIADADKGLQDWRTKYNCERPHEALNMHCPAEIYTKSERDYPGIITPYEYSGENHIIKVNSWGYVRFAGFQVYISETFIGDYLEFRHSEDGNSFIVCYRNFKIAEFDSASGERLNRKISRL